MFMFQPFNAFNINTCISASFCETNLELDTYAESEYPQPEDSHERTKEPEATSTTTTDPEVTGRRVSFQLDNLQSTPSGYLRQGRRFGKTAENGHCT